MGDNEKEALFKAAIQDNQIDNLIQLFNENFKPNQETLTAAFRNALEVGHDRIAMALIHYNKLKNWNMHFNLDFMIAGKTPLAYAVSKKNPELVKQLLTCDIHFPLSAPKKNKDEPVAEFTDPEEELISLAVSNLRKYTRESEDVLRLLLAAGADISKAKYLGGVLLRLKDEHSELKDALYPEEKNTASNLRDFILEEFKQKNKNKYEHMCADLLGHGYALYEINPELYQKIVSLEEDNMDQLYKRYPNELEERIKYFFQTGIERSKLNACREWLQLLTDAGIPTLEIYNQAKQEFLEREMVPKISEHRLNEPTLEYSDFFLYGMEHVRNKLDNLFIPQEELDKGLEDVLGSYLGSLLKPEVILEYTALLLATGAKLDIKNEYFIRQYQISDIEHADVEFFKYLAKNKLFDLAKLMLKSGLRFKEDYSFSLLEQLMEDANNNKDQALLDILEPQYLQEKNIRQAKVDYQKNNLGLADSKEASKQNEVLRIALFKAIGEANFDKVIELVGRGANPNYGFHMLEDQYFVQGLNLKGLSPAHFACLTLKEGNAKEMFQLLLDLGANIRIINEYSQTFAKRDLHELFERDTNQQLYHAIVRAELNPPSIPNDPTIAKDKKEQEHRAKLQKISKTPSHLQFISGNTEAQRPSNQFDNKIKKNRGIH